MADYSLINHVVSVRLRLQGVGTLESQLEGIDNTPVQLLPDVTLALTPGKPVSLLSNIKSTALRYYAHQDAIDEYFTIRNITFFNKPTATGYPQ